MRMIMKGKKILMWLALVAAVTLFVVGCADGILFEKQREDGGMQRLRLDSGESWDTFDTTPRYRSQKARDNDDYSIMLKNEATF